MLPASVQTFGRAQPVALCLLAPPVFVYLKSEVRPDAAAELCASPEDGPWPFGLRGSPSTLNILLRFTAFYP